MDGYNTYVRCVWNVFDLSAFRSGFRVFLYLASLYLDDYLH